MTSSWCGRRTQHRNVAGGLGQVCALERIEAVYGSTCADHCGKCSAKFLMRMVFDESGFLMKVDFDETFFLMKMVLMRVVFTDYCCVLQKVYFLHGRMKRQ